MPTRIDREGPTPNGGDRAVLYFQDAQGELAEQAVATRFELVEYDSTDNEIFRSYGTLKEPSETGGSDGSQAFAV